MSAAIKQARANFQGDMGYGRAMPGTGFAGDPGLFGSIFGGVAKGLGMASRFIPGGGALSAGIGLVRRLRGGGARNIGTRRGRDFQMQLGPGPRRQRTLAMQAGLPVQNVPGLRGLAQRIIPGGATGLQVPGEAIGARVPQGYHLNKSGYYRGGRPKSDIPQVEWVPEESIFVKNRKRNPLNPRAWDRAFGRLNSAQNFKKKMGRITIREKC